LWSGGFLNTLIKVINLKKSFGKYEALRGVNVSFREGHQYAIQGASGSGKSTLLYLIGGLDLPTAGQIYWKDKSLPDLDDKELASYRNKEVGFVFQFGLFH